jgi:tetratricopeptide (TPR) repeat protein
VSVLGRDASLSERTGETAGGSSCGRADRGRGQSTRGDNGPKARDYQQAEPEAAIERFARAMRLSPLDPSLRTPSGTAHAHFFLGRYDEAASWAAMALQDNADYQPGLRIAAASNSMAGRPEQAHKAVARLRLLNPTLRVSTLKDVLGPFRQAEDLLRYEEGLRGAGLPE